MLVTCSDFVETIKTKPKKNKQTNKQKQKAKKKKKKKNINRNIILFGTLFKQCHSKNVIGLHVAL